MTFWDFSCVALVVAVIVFCIKDRRKDPVTGEDSDMVNFHRDHVPHVPQNGTILDRRILTELRYIKSLIVRNQHIDEVGIISDEWREEAKNSGKTMPPDTSDHMSWHFLHSERASNTPIAQWDAENRNWLCAGEEARVSPEEMRTRGWEYLGAVSIRPTSYYLD